MKVFQIRQSIAHFDLWKQLISQILFKKNSTGRKLRLLRSFSRSPRPKFQNHLIFITFCDRISSFWISRSFDLGDLCVLKKSPVNIFNDYIFEISLFHWSKCTIECAIRLTLILKSAQARCDIGIWTCFGITANSLGDK